jgi:hypothetical protein
MQSLGVEIMNKLKVGDIVYIAEFNSIEEIEYIIDECALFGSPFWDHLGRINEHLDLGFVIKLEL